MFQRFANWIYFQCQKKKLLERCVESQHIHKVAFWGSNSKALVQVNVRGWLLQPCCENVSMSLLPLMRISAALGGHRTQDKHQTHLHPLIHTHTHTLIICYHVFIFKWDKALKLWLGELERKSVVVENALCFWSQYLLESVALKRKKDIQEQNAIVPNACSVSIYIFSHKTINRTKYDQMKLHVSRENLLCACLHGLLMSLRENVL